MIEITRGNILRADAEALVNTVNCVGYMGKGIALQFKKAFPANFKAYERACRAEKVVLGKMFVFATNSFVNPKYIINFPTKRHWRGKSRLADIESGLRTLIEEVKKLDISSVAIPPLGCGLGGLNWGVVRSMIEKALAELPGVQVLLFEPAGAPDARAMPVRTQQPKMTVARALLVKLMQQYAETAYRLTLLEIQKLAYFLQEAGEPLRLKYERHIYGPYAHNLNKVLEVMEGHFTQGYGDTQKPDVEIELLSGTTQKADKFLETHREYHARLQRVEELIEGFETPYGMELLSSVHWVARHDSTAARNADEAVQKIHEWTDRKQRMFRSEHICIAWDRLTEKGWLPQTPKN
ncbi:MAG: macro domain-containing protein [Phycisphaerae bacterium]|nr:macro domain-containing protein [Phycisphaerae bacterium]